MTRDLSGLLLGAFGAILFSMKGIVLKLAFAEGASVEQMMALRMGISLPFFIIVAAISLRRRKKPLAARTLWMAAGLGILSYYVCTWLDFTGLQFISAQLERLILFLYPTMTAFLAWGFLGDRITWRHGVALVLSYAGVALLVVGEIQYFGSNVVLGTSLVFAAAVLFAGYVVSAKPVITALGSALFTSLAMSAASIAILIHFGVQAATGPVPALNSDILVLGAVLAIACTIAPSYMIAAAINRVGPGLSSAVGGIGPAATAGVAVMVLGEPFGWPQAFALVLTVSGVLLLATASTKPAASGTGRTA